MIISRLHSIMGDRRLKLSNLKTRTGLAYGTLHTMYHGRQERIDYNTLNALCRALDCQPGDLLEYVSDGKGEEGR